VQVPRIFAQPGGKERPVAVPIPRMTVLLYRVLPYFWYGTVYFCFLFADRFTASASVAALTGAPFGLRPEYKLGMDLALLSFLFASAGVEYANIRFTHHLREAARIPFNSQSKAFERAMRRIHLRAIATVGVGFVLTAALVAGFARWLLSDILSRVWTTMAIGQAGYLLLALGLLNALVLLTLNRPWSAVRALTAGLVLNIGIGYVLSHAFDAYFAAAGLLAGSALLCIQSTLMVRRTLGRADHAIAA
jgi:hypothetical protein